MNYVHTMLIISLSFSCACNAMKREQTNRTSQFDTLHLTFAAQNQELGVTKGAQEAAHIISLSTDTKDILRPLLNEMTEKASHLDEHEEAAKNRLKGFFTAFSIVLYKHNRKNPNNAIKIDKEMFDTRMKEFQAGANKNKQKSREELVKLLTTSLTSLNLL